MSDINEAQPEMQPEQTDELDVQDLEDVAGGAAIAPADDLNGNCGTNCHC